MRAYRQSVWVAVAAYAGLGWVAACSLDEFSNPQRLDSDDCSARGGTPITEKFCRLAPADAGVDAAEGGSDAAEPSDDAGAKGEPCDETVNKQELCYDGADQNTSLQPPCRAGSRTCQGGFWGPCEKQVLPAPETCNGDDDDCDGRVDEQLNASECAVESEHGRCAGGMLLCVAGTSECIQLRLPRSETCNGDDDDCDGQVDEHTERECNVAANGCEQIGSDSYKCLGICRVGWRACVDGHYEDVCKGGVAPAASERCTDVGGVALDEDCDDEVDEGCTCKSGAICYTGSPSDTAKTAPCHAGKWHCSDPTHGECQDEVKPKAEDCTNEGMDDDCDGVTDNIPTRDKSCVDVSKGRGACKAGARYQCKDGNQVCADAEAKTEVCDGQSVDEDCDGKVDEGFALDTDPMNCGACGVQCGAGNVCCAGSCVTTSSSNPHCGGCGKACAATETCCDGSCKQTLTDYFNCGGCGKACFLQSCSAGACGGSG